MSEFLIRGHDNLITSGPQIDPELVAVDNVETKPGNEGLRSFYSKKGRSLNTVSRDVKLECQRNIFANQTACQRPNFIYT